MISLINFFSMLLKSLTWHIKIRNAARYNNSDDLANHSFILKVLIYSEVYLEPSRTSLINLVAKIAESC